MLAVYEFFLRKYTRETDILIGCHMAGRGDGTDRHTVGYFVNFIPLRGDLRNNPTFAEHLASTTARLAAAKL